MQQDIQQNIDGRLNQAEQKLGFLSKFLTPIMAMLDDHKFFGLPLRILYYLIAIANLAIPLVCLVWCGFIFTLAPFFPAWAWITVPIFCLLLLAVSAVIGVGSFTFWVRRYSDIKAYNMQNRNYMALRNFALMQRTFGEWIGLIVIFLGVVNLLSIFIPTEIISGMGVGVLGGNIISTILETIVCIVIGYIVIFLAKVMYDYMEGFANKAADTRDIADIERLKMEIED